MTTEQLNFGTVVGVIIGTMILMEFIKLLFNKVFNGGGLKDHLKQIDKRLEEGQKKFIDKKDLELRINVHEKDCEGFKGSTGSNRMTSGDNNG